MSLLEGLPDGRASETGPSVQSDTPYRRFQLAIYAQSPVGEFTNPVGMALGPDGSLYVADANNHRIQHFGATGALLNIWGTVGSGDGQFSYPTGVAVAVDGTVYVADSRNDRIQRFTATGEYLGQWGEYGSGDGRFRWPTEVDIGPDGTVYVADTWNHRIQRFDATGAFLDRWGSYGAGDGQFADPYGVAVAADGTVYVADSGNHRIQRFGATGTYLGEWGNYGSGNGQLEWPTGVALSLNGDVYVADTNNQRIQRFGAAGTYLGKWGTYGTGDGQFAFPRAVEVTADGTVYVVDDDNHRIQRFALSGQYLGKWGSRGRSAGQITAPFGVALANDGSIYVADTENQRIQHFSVTGAYLGEWGDYGSGNGQFWWPSGIAVAGDGTVYVADTQQNRIQRFTFAGTYLGQWGSYGLGDSQFNGPLDVAVAPDGSVYVADTWNHRIQRFTATGVYLGKWGSEGSDNGQFRWPYGVTVDPSGTVYVADQWNFRIQRFTATGGYLGQWGVSGSGAGGFWVPSGVSAAADGTIYVADTGNHRIQHFTNTGTYLGQWGSRGSSEAQFYEPTGIAVATDGTVYVADRRNDRIQAFGSAYPETWRGEYFGNRWLAGRPLLIRDESAIDFEWETGSPGPDIPVGQFSSRWQRYVHLDRTGRYRFSLLVDSGGRLWVNDQLLIEEWRHPQRALYSETLHLDAGYHSVRLEHYAHEEGAVARLDYEYVDTTPPESNATSPVYAKTSPIPVSWTASDDDSGVASTTLWTKFGSGGTWASTEQIQTGTVGTFSYTPANGEGTYYFATVATDHSGNVEAPPNGDGDTSTVYDITNPASQVQVPELERASTASLPWTASDNLSGVAKTTLWVKFGPQGTWTATDLSQSGTQGTFEYPFTQGQGTYYFAAVSTDRAGNVEDVPRGPGDGGCEYGLYHVYLPLSLQDYISYFEGPWEVEPNNTWQQANGPLISGRAYYGYPNDTRDYFSIYTRRAGQITVNLTGHIGQGVQLQLFYQGINNRVDHDLEAPYEITYSGPPGWYYILIYTESGHNETSPYTLRVTYPE